MLPGPFDIFLCCLALLPDSPQAGCYHLLLPCLGSMGPWLRGRLWGWTGPGRSSPGPPPARSRAPTPRQDKEEEAGLPACLQWGGRGEPGRHTCVQSSSNSSRAPLRNHTSQSHTHTHPKACKHSTHRPRPPSCRPSNYTCVCNDEAGKKKINAHPESSKLTPKQPPPRLGRRPAGQEGRGEPGLPRSEEDRAPLVCTYAHTPSRNLDWLGATATIDRSGRSPVCPSVRPSERGSSERPLASEGLRLTCSSRSSSGAWSPAAAPPAAIPLAGRPRGCCCRLPRKNGLELEGGGG